MVYVNFPKDLENRELRAYRIEESEVRKGDKSKKLSDVYTGIGKDCEERGFLEKAISNYKDARKFATSGRSVEEIEKKLSELEKKRKGTLKFLKKTRGGIEKYFLFATLAIISLVGALIFTSFNLTGYAVGELTQNSSRWIGVCLFACGLIFSFFYFKNKK